MDMKYWEPWDKALRYADQLAINVECDTDGRGLIVELGPGKRPFRHAREFAGREPETRYEGTFHRCDLSRDYLPWSDDEVAFLYCRHTLEDLDDPEWCLSEIQRVARAGYIETPSPVAELTRGVDAGDDRPPWRGYHHHRSIVWDSNGVLSVVAKYPIVEHMDLNGSRVLRDGPLHWNTYFSWTGQLPYKVHRHEVDYQISTGYGALLDRALKESQESCGRFCEAAEGKR